jgi:hypothetical protein
MLYALVLLLGILRLPGLVTSYPLGNLIPVLPLFAIA